MTKPSARAKPAEPAQTKPTLANVAYGTHERQVLDFWKAESSRPTPVLFHIHGGGWVAGDKARVASLDKYLAAGISVVSINYRYVTQAMLAGVKPPVQWPLQRCRAGLAVRPQQGGRVEHRQAAHRRHGRFGGRVFEPVARVAQRPGRPAEQRPGRARIHAPVVRRRDRRPDLARSATTQGMDAQQPLWRPRVRLHARPEGHEDARHAVRGVPRRAGIGPAVDQGVLALRTRHGGRPADLPRSTRPRPRSARSRRTRRTRRTTA